MPANPDCVFCKIVNGEIPAMTVWEDDRVLAFLDIQPLQKGHVLVIPRAHAPGLQDLDPEDAAALGRAIREVTARAQKGMGVDAATVAVNNGENAGQEVPHVHVHVIPRAAGDGIGPIHGLFKGKAPDVAKDELAGIQARIRDAL